MMKIIKKYPLSTICIITIWTLSLLPFFPETPLDDVAFIDKWTHFVMYGGTALVIFFENNRNLLKAHNYSHLPIQWWYVILVVFCLSLMGGLLELLQANCTGGHRSGEWLDFVADSVGAVLGAIINIAILRKLQFRIFPK